MAKGQESGAIVGTRVATLSSGVKIDISDWREVYFFDVDGELLITLKFNDLATVRNMLSRALDNYRSNVLREAKKSATTK